MGHRTSTASLMVIGLLACAYSDDSSSPPPPTPDDFDQYYVGAWELTSVNDSFEGPDRPATADEARTWHVFPSEAYDAGSYRSPVTVDWGGPLRQRILVFRSAGARGGQFTHSSWRIRILRP